MSSLRQRRTCTSKSITLAVCVECGLPFSRTTDYEKHTQQFHPSGKSRGYNCTICGAEFREKAQFDHHYPCFSDQPSCSTSRRTSTRAASAPRMSTSKSSSSGRTNARIESGTETETAPPPSTRQRSQSTRTARSSSILVSAVDEPADVISPPPTPPTLTITPAHPNDDAAPTSQVNLPAADATEQQPNLPPLPPPPTQPQPSSSNRTTNETLTTLTCRLCSAESAFSTEKIDDMVQHLAGHHKIEGTKAGDRGLYSRLYNKRCTKCQDNISSKAKGPHICPEIVYIKIESEDDDDGTAAAQL